MPTYVVIGKANGASVVSLTVDNIFQEPRIVPDIDVVNAVRAFLATVPGVQSVTVEKREWVSTVV